jgi:PAS domain S-box-containing protein
MKYHKLLSKQILKYLPPDFTENSSIEKFLSVISDSYIAFDKDKVLGERAFQITEEEYLEVNNQLKHEVDVRRQSVEKLKQAIGKINGVEKTNNTDDLLIIARYLNQQVSKRINAELVFNSLITNLPSAILLEDESGQIVLTNHRFCEMFSLTLPPEALQSTDSSKNLEEIKHLFKNPGKFSSRVVEILKIKKLVTGEIVELADGTILKRDYIPIFLENKYKGNLWSYTDITETKRAEEEYKRISLVASANQNGVLFTSFDGKITWANEGFYKMTGFCAEETIGKTPIELCRGPLTDKDSLAKVLDAFYTGKPFHVEIIYYRKDGSWFWGRSNTQPVKDNKGQVTQFFGIIDDVTEEKGTEDRFRMALEKIGDNVWEYNFELDETLFSDNESQLLGYSKSDFNNNIDLWRKNIFPEDRPILEQNDISYKIGQQSHHTLEYRMIHKSGEIKWVLDKGVVIEKTVDDKPLRIIGTHTDITSIKQTEQALRENEKQFRSLAESIPGVLYKFEYGNDGIERFTYISPDPEKKIGVTKEQLEDFYKILHPSDFEREKRISKNARENKMPYHFEGRFNVPKTPVIWLNFCSSFSHISPEGRSVYTGIILDITKEKESEQVIHMRERKYRNIIANMNLGLLEVDNEENVRFVNQSFCEMCGYQMEELVGKSVSRLFAKDEDSEMMELKNQSRKKGLSDAYEILVKNKKGELRWWLISGAPRYSDKGLLVGSIGIHLDITEQKRLEHDLVEAREQAESLAGSKQIFLANMSHEIRTPINAIIGMSNQLSKSMLTKDQLFDLNIIHSAAENLLVIMNDILDLSKLETGKLNTEEIGFKRKA